MNTGSNSRTICLGLLALLLSGCVDLATAPEQAASEPLLPTPAEVVLDRRAPPPGQVLQLYRRAARTELALGVTHYRFEVRLGPRQFDIVRIHRIVRESRPRHPIVTDGAVFLTHGGGQDFEASFLRAGADVITSQTSLPVFLAERNVDVWGMDFAWTLVPEATTDFSFMQDWGVERDADHTLAAMSIARMIRGVTRQGFGPMNLLGYSFGAGIAYAAAGRETQQPPTRRHIRGLIPVDMIVESPAPESSPFNPCGLAELAQSQLDAGVFHGAFGLFANGLAEAAANAPDEPSAVFDGLTNHQAALFLGTNTFALNGREFWHLVGGELDTSGLPVGLLYSDRSRWLGLLASLPPYAPVRANFEQQAAVCDNVDVSMDDHLTEISVPILYLGAQGGFGSAGHYTVGLTASDDVTLHTVSLQPESRRTVDFGHSDLLLGEEAHELVWEVLADWLLDENHASPRQGAGEAHVGPGGVDVLP